MTAVDLVGRLEALLATRGSASAEELGLSVEEAIEWGQTRLDLEGVFLVRMRSLLGEIRVDEVRADAFPAHAALCREEGFYAEEARFSRLCKREEVPFPLCLYGDETWSAEQAERLRKARSVLERAFSMRVTRPRRAEQAVVSVEPLFASVSPRAALLLWMDAAEMFIAVGDHERARRCLTRLARLTRRAALPMDELVQSVLALLQSQSAALLPRALIDAMRARLPKREGLSLQLYLLRKKLEQAETIPDGTLIELLSDANAGAEDEAKSEVDEARLAMDQALLGMLDLPGLWRGEGETHRLRRYLLPLVKRAIKDGLPLRRAASHALRRALEVVDSEGILLFAAFLLELGFEEQPALSFDVTIHLLFRSAPGRFSSHLDLAIGMLLRLAEEAPAQLFPKADELAPALSAALAFPTMRAVSAALFADLDAVTHGMQEDGVTLSAHLRSFAQGTLSDAEPASPSRRYPCTARERAFARWLPAPFADPLRRALQRGDVGSSLADLWSTKELGYVALLRLLGLAQDERTDRALAEDVLGLSEALLSLCRHDTLRPDALIDADPTLSLLTEIDFDAVQEGISLSRKALSDRASLRPRRWPAPRLGALASLDEARFVLLTFALGRLEAGEVGSHHLAFARLAHACPLVRLGAGHLSPSPHALGDADSSTLARLCRRSLARFSAPQESALRDVVVLVSPMAFAEAFAKDLGLFSRTAIEEPEKDEPAPEILPARSGSLHTPDPAPELQLSERHRRAWKRPFLVPAKDTALPLAPIIAAHSVSLGTHGEITVHGTRGQPLRRAPRVVQHDEAYRALVRGRNAERARKRSLATNLEARMTSATPFEPDELTFLLDDPLIASLLRHAIIGEARPDGSRPTALYVLHRWEKGRGLGVIPLDYDAHYLPPMRIELVHPARIDALGAFRALVEDLGFRQGLPQLFRDTRALPAEELDQTESRALFGRAVSSSAALLHALSAEGFATGRGMPTRRYSHVELKAQVELWLDAGQAAWATDAVVAGAFGFHSLGGQRLSFREIPLPILCEARSSLERALARAATRTAQGL